VKASPAEERYGTCLNPGCEEYGRLVAYPPLFLTRAPYRGLPPQMFPPKHSCPRCSSVSLFLTPVEILALSAKNEV